MIEEIKENIKKLHDGDEKQMSVVFSNTNRLLIEAPAGYGKTKTMVSKIAYMLASSQIPYPKRILALTFSVNAAYKIKKDVTQNIPAIIPKMESSYSISDKIFVSNYHGFARRILKKYGTIIHANLAEIDTLQSIDDGNATNLMQSIAGLSSSDAEILSNFNASIKGINAKYAKDNLENYNAVVISTLLPLKVIPYNAILSLCCKLLKEHLVIRTFYQKLYQTILVDEYQDTNLLSYWLLHCIFSDSSNILVFGDSLQRIYGFIGAIPNLLNVTEKQFKLEKIELNKNYRFKENATMLLLDKNLRLNAENPTSPSIADVAKVEFVYTDDQQHEASHIVNFSLDILSKNTTSKVAVLFKSRNKNTDAVIDEFNTKEVAFFYGLFTDEDSNYIQYNRECLFEFIELLRANPNVTKKLAALLQKAIEKKINRTDALTLSLHKLLSVFLSKLFSDFSFLSNEEKIVLIKDTFEHNGLKQYVEFVESNIVVSTVHGAKGLEWDFVIIPDMESFSFPNYYGLCGSCGTAQTCDLKMRKDIEPKFLEDLSVFYVAVTRARKQVYFCASKTAINFKGEVLKRNMSCFLKLPGISV